MRALVTGANGFLGSYLVEELLKQGYDVRALVRESSDLQSLKGLDCEVVQGDILNMASLVKPLDDVSCVFHTASYMTSSPKEREKLFAVNVQGTNNVVSVCEARRIQKLVHVSSVVAVGASLYGEVLDEDSSNVTKSFGFANYDSKRLGEEKVLSAAREKRLDACVVNPGLMYGARDARKPIRKGNIKVAQGRLPVYTKGGVNVVAVEDVAKGMIAAAEKGQSGERYLLTGENILIETLFAKIAEFAGAKAPSKGLPNKLLKGLAAMHDLFGLKGELSRENVFAATAFHWYDNTKANRALEFNPGPAEEALRKSVEWMKASGILERA